MEQKNFMIAVLLKQHRLLDQLAEQIENESQPEMEGCLFWYERATAKITENLRQWLEIQKSYLSTR